MTIDGKRAMQLAWATWPRLELAMTIPDDAEVVLQYHDPRINEVVSTTANMTWGEVEELREVKRWCDAFSAGDPSRAVHRLATEYIDQRDEVERLERMNDKLQAACRFAKEHLNDNGLSSAPSVADVLDAALAEPETGGGSAISPPGVEP